MHYKTLAALAASWLTLGPAAGAEERVWSLGDCVSYALETNTSVRQAQISAESSDVDVRQARAALFPSLTFSSSQTLHFQKTESQSYSSYDAQVKTPTYSGSYNLGLNLTLWDGMANVNTLRKDRLDRQTSELNVRKAANSLQVQVIRAYYQILYAHESVETDAEIVEVARRELERTQKKLEVGKCSKVDVAQMESQYQQNLYSLVGARNQEAAYVLQLKQLLMLDPETPFAVDYGGCGDADVLRPVVALGDALEMALGYLPDVRAAQLGVESAHMQEKIARGGWQPTVSLNAGVSTSNGNNITGTFGDQVNSHLSENVGVSVSVPILDGRRTRSAVDRARLQVASSVVAEADARTSVENTIASLHLDIQSAQSRYQAALAAEAAARESFDLMDQRYGVGLESVVDLLTEKNRYLAARQETLQAKYTALMDLRLMDFYTGDQPSYNP